MDDLPLQHTSNVIIIAFLRPRFFEPEISPESRQAVKRAKGGTCHSLVRRHAALGRAYVIGESDADLGVLG